MSQPFHTTSGLAPLHDEAWPSDQGCVDMLGASLTPAEAYSTNIRVFRAMAEVGRHGIYTYTISLMAEPPQDLPIETAIESESPLGHVLSKMCEFVAATLYSRTKNRMQYENTTTKWSKDPEIIGWQKAVQRYCADPGSTMPGVALTYNPNSVASGVDAARQTLQWLQTVGQPKSLQDSSDWPTSQQSIKSALDESGAVDIIEWGDLRAYVKRWVPPPPDPPGTVRIATYPEGYQFEIGATAPKDLEPGAVTLNQGIPITFDQQKFYVR